MTTTTTYSVLPIPAEALRSLRLTDDAGRPAVPYADPEGDEMLRCCLRRSVPGERIALVAYAPLRRWAAETGAEPGAYDEQGPVLIHAEECPGWSGPGLPFTHAQRVLRRYSAQGHIIGGQLVGEDFSAALDEAFSEPEVASVHVRAVKYGCFLYEVRRA
ncbi:hypothetical protein Shyhy01_53520 [Streptomyces hygroscopicus subsp. hygroscopicus]|nr:DUF1203 domain-containing protein [Streptomyces hygroscopicus]GLX52402.1 hypothetical protein Shyhy01_53520 [Streptomyces hygroscopicus subsp. hygroscopicus]